MAVTTAKPLFSAHRINNAIALILLVFMYLQPVVSYAHETGSISLTILKQDNALQTVSVELDADDVMLMIAMDSNNDDVIRWAEYLKHRPALFDYISKSLNIKTNGEKCSLTSLDEKSGVRFKSYPSIYSVFDIDCKSKSPTIQIENTLLSDISENPLTLIQITGQGSEVRQLSTSSNIEVSVESDTNLLSSYLVNGIYHVLIGVDHLAFLLLLMMAVYYKHDPKRSIVKMAGIVTAFTLAHTLTLSMVAIGYISLPVKPVEVVIALSIIITGLINVLFPKHQLGWVIAYVFGLVHGLGFANVLMKMAGDSQVRLIDLALFNLGVEVGQLLFVIATTVVISLALKSSFRINQLFRLSSLFISLVGIVWVIQRL